VGKHSTSGERLLYQSRWPVRYLGGKSFVAVTAIQLSGVFPGAVCLSCVLLGGEILASGSERAAGPAPFRSRPCSALGSAELRPNRAGGTNVHQVLATHVPEIQGPDQRRVSVAHLAVPLQATGVQRLVEAARRDRA